MTIGELIEQLKTFNENDEIWMEVDAGIDRVGGVENIVSGPAVIFPKVKK